MAGLNRLRKSVASHIFTLMSLPNDHPLHILEIQRKMGRYLDLESSDTCINTVVTLFG